MRNDETGRPGLRLTLAALVLITPAAACDAIGSSGNGGDPGAGTEAASLQGETIEFVVPYDPGGGYDIYARLAAPYIEKCTGATVTVQNEPGAGGLVATTQTFVSPPDDLRIQITNNIGLIGAQIAEAEGVQFDLREFSWLGRVSTEPNVLVVASDSDLTAFQDILTSDEPISFAATGPGSNEYINATVLPKVYDFPSKIVTGFASGDDARASILAGDVDAHIQPLDSQISMIESGELRPLLLIAEKPSELLPDTPTVSDIQPESQEQQAILDQLLALTKSGRGVVASPNVEPGLRAALEDAVGCALSNKKLIAEVEKQQRSIMPMSGEQMSSLIDKLLSPPKNFRTLVREAS